MMRSFMALTWGAELDDGLNGSDTMLFPEENGVMTVYGDTSRQGGATCLA
jgi:hypothetical protein